MNVVLAVLLPLLVAYTPTLLWCIDRWNAPTQYFAHCWLVPPLAAWLAYSRRRQWGAVPRRCDPRGLWLLVPGLVLHLAGALLMVDSWSAASLCLSVPGAAWFALGRERLRGSWPIVWLVLFVVPLPMYVEGRLAFVLKEVAVEGGTRLANLVGAAVQRSGDLLRPAGVDGALYVADACGGLRSLLAMVTLAYCLAFFVGQPRWPRRLGLLLAAAPVAVAANVVRIAVLCLLARWFGVPFAEGTGHTLANGAEWLADLVVLLALDRWWSRRPVATAAPTVVAGVAPSLRPAGTLRWAALGLWCAAVPLGGLAAFRPAAVGGARAEQLPAWLAGHVLVPRSEAAEQRFRQNLPRYRELLGTDDFVWRHYRGEDGRWLSAVALFHDTNWKSVHPPRICIEGSNMDIEADTVEPAAWLGDGASVSRIVARRRDTGRRFVTLSVFGTRDWLSGSYSEFTWHHLPLALLRRNQSGFLLRIEAALGDDAAAAERSCREFLAALVPAAREVLR
ncbi:MAG: exosortase/archaeosortase family protein [Planctomycetes bacterium]|nr:exosortase/archaeosortase family protein [Planctomycetota bacterium]